ncbi:BCL-6 corepressor-like protein 1 isoform X1 [Coregonus clupeaformis]|uniref:BCL-6 corepressor-like protein 1 isoform X1 n=2 Tax=Coregonus clupeaformis TaxID=59861 RepID=UPI001E1C6ED0|nr:BCL-6 corepressor-like protein 1 isoform X1 [Coregonus clupeaformis]
MSLNTEAVRIASYTEEDPIAADLRSGTPKECCVKETHMQVDPTPMNVGDGGTVSREIGAPIKAFASMVGNPSQTLPPKLRGDVSLSQQNKTTTATDCKMPVNVCSDPSNFNHCPVVSPPQEHNNAPTSGLPLISSDKRTDKRSEVPKPKADGPGVFPTHQWPCGTKNRPEDPVNPSHSSVTSNKKPHTQTQSVISLPAGFQCSTLFKPGQPVTFLPSTNFSSPLCKITLPPALGQIAALREATASQFQKGSQPQSADAGVAPLLQTYPYHFSVGRCPAPQKKTPKLKCNSTSSSKSSKAGGEHKSSIASVVASPTITLPIQHPALGSAPPTRFTLSPSAAICCGPALASITSQGRLLNHVEKDLTHRSSDKTSVGFLKLKAPSAAEDRAVACPTEARDVPLDLSAKSKRPKTVKDPPNTVATTEHLLNEARQKVALHPKRPHTATYGSAAPYPILPNTHRNGALKQTSRPLTHHGLETNSSWVKGSSQGPINNLPGTYVGVASPILASTLRSKDGKGSFEDEFQTFARQETISIIDQGEHLASRGKKASFMTKGNQHVYGIKHPNSTSPAVTQSCPSKGAFATALPGSANSHSHQKSGSVKAAIPYSLTVLKPLWQRPALLPHQGASVQRKVIQGTPKVKRDTGSDGPTFQSAHQSQSRMEAEKWDRTKSPLSNLESIVKQKALETTALTGEGYCHLSPVACRKPEVVSSHTMGQDTLLHQTAAFGCPPIRSVENKDTLSFQGDSTQVMNKLEKTSVSESQEKSTEKHVKLGEQAGVKEIQVSANSTSHTHAIGSSGSANRNRMDSKLAKELEGGTVKEESTAPAGLAPRAKLEGIALSILTGQCAGVAEVEKKTNGTKEESPTKATAAFTKQKKPPSPRKPAKEKASPDHSKKAAAPVKKKQDQETTPVKKEPSPKKKPCAPVLEHSLSLAEPSPHREGGENTRREKSSPTDNKQAAHNKPGSGSSPLPSPQRCETPVSLSSPGRPSKEPVSSESSTPRLRRGRRRADEARLDDWGFATPSPPPPPTPPPPPIYPPPQPARRPRGRPRTNPLPEKADQCKVRPAPSTEGDTLKRKKRNRCRNRKYQNGEYITAKDKDGEGEERSVPTRQGTRSGSDLRTGMYPRLSATLTCRGTSPEPGHRRPSFTRSGSVRRPERGASPEPSDKPSGKRKFKSKHLSDTDEPKKLKTKRSSLAKRPASVVTNDDSPSAKKPAGLLATPKGPTSPPASKKGTSGRGGAPESPPSRPVPPEVRRLIVNKNAGETLLQRAARLGYQDVVHYCLEKDVREVNRRDNAGYTALHEACSRGWSHIVQVLLKYGADVNCSAQDGTRPIHDAVASDNLPVVWMLLNHGADPTLTTYSGQTVVKLAQSPSMKTFLKEYFTDLEGRSDQDPSLPWDFYSSSVFETGQEACWDFLLSQREEEERDLRKERDSDRDCLLFEFSSEPLLPCYHVQVSLTQGFCNWFLLTAVLKRLKMSSRIFGARYPHLEVVSLARTELWRQVSVSQVSTASAQPQGEEEEEDREEGEGPVELVRCVPELQGLLGSSIHILQEDEGEEEGDRTDTATPCSR